MAVHGSFWRGPEVLSHSAQSATGPKAISLARSTANIPRLVHRLCSDPSGPEFMIGAMGAGRFACSSPEAQAVFRVLLTIHHRRRRFRIPVPIDAIGAEDFECRPHRRHRRKQFSVRFSSFLLHVWLASFGQPAVGYPFGTGPHLLESRSRVLACNVPAGCDRPPRAR
jgi:hypothetical protein